jgi:hypothetical protein
MCPIKSCDKTSAVYLIAGWMWVKKKNLTKCLHSVLQPVGHHKCSQKPWNKISTFDLQSAGHHKCGKKHMTKCPHFAWLLARHHNCIQKPCDKPSKFCFRKGRTWCHIAFWGGLTSCYMWQTFNTWTDRSGERMSQGQIVKADSSLCGRIVWVELSCGRFVSGRIVKEPAELGFSPRKLLAGPSFPSGTWNFTVMPSTRTIFQSFRICEIFPIYKLQIRTCLPNNGSRLYYVSVDDIMRYVIFPVPWRLRHPPVGHSDTPTRTIRHCNDSPHVMLRPCNTTSAIQLDPG